MARVILYSDHDIKPAANVIMTFRAGKEYTVRREWADEMIAAHKAKEVKPPRRRTKASGD